MSSSFESEPPVGRLVTGRTAACRRGARRRVAVALDVGLVLAAWSSAAQAFTLKFTGPSNRPGDGLQQPDEGAATGRDQPGDSLATLAIIPARTRFYGRTRLSEPSPGLSLCAARATLRRTAFAISWLAPGSRRSRVPRNPGKSTGRARCVSRRRSGARRLRSTGGGQFATALSRTAGAVRGDAPAGAQ